MLRFFGISSYKNLNGFVEQRRLVPNSQHLCQISRSWPRIQGHDEYFPQSVVSNRKVCSQLIRSCWWEKFELVISKKSIQFRKKFHFHSLSRKKRLESLFFNSLGIHFEVKVLFCLKYLGLNFSVKVQITQFKNRLSSNAQSWLQAFSSQELLNNCVRFLSLMGRWDTGTWDMVCTANPIGETVSLKAECLRRWKVPESTRWKNSCC